VRGDEGKGLVVAGPRGNVDVLTAVDAVAARRGLRPGLALAEARAMYPALDVVPEDAAADARLLDALAELCQRYTPLIAVDSPDGLKLDIGGCAHLFGGEADLVADLSARLTRLGFAHRIAVAGTIGAAWAAARFAPDHDEFGLDQPKLINVIDSKKLEHDVARKPLRTFRHHAPAGIIADGEERALLMPLPLAALRLDGETVAALARVGLKRIGDIIDLPRAPLAARFGAMLLRQLDRALGREHEPLTPILPVAPYIADQPFPEPIAREEDVLAAIERLAARLKHALERQGEGARTLALALFRTDGAVRHIGIATARPLRDPQAIRALFVERLAALGDDLDPGFGFDLARLSVVTVEPVAPQQIGLGSPDDAADLARLIDRLSARLGSRRITRLIAHDSHIPELAAGTVPAQCGSAESWGEGWEAFRLYRETAELPARPLRLLMKPEPIEAVAEVPDGPPLRFRWRRALHEVIAAEGPERIEGLWWSEEGGPARDYFHIEDKTGLRFWLFRAGLFRDIAMPRWFMHGMGA
jgi:protein ImuB